MSTARVPPQNRGQILVNPNLLRDTAIGLGLGLLMGRPLLGAAGGAGYNLFSTPGMADGMKSAAQDAFHGVGAQGGVEEALRALGKTLFGGADGAKTRAEPAAAESNAKQAEQKSGIPGWAKWALGGAGAIALMNNVFDPLAMNGFGNPWYGGYGMDPFMGAMGPMMGPAMMGPMPASNLFFGMDLVDLLIAGGLAAGAHHLMKRAPAPEGEAKPTAANKAAG